MAFKFTWHATTMSGGSLSLSLEMAEKISKSLTKKQKEGMLAATLQQCVTYMQDRGDIPYNTSTMSSRDIAKRYGNTRQYWEKLLNEGKILYKETSAGRITTELWVKGYLDDKEKVDRYAKQVRKILDSIVRLRKRQGVVPCSACEEGKFRYYANYGGNTNGVCDNCGLHVHAFLDPDEAKFEK